MWPNDVPRNVQHICQAFVAVAIAFHLHFVLFCYSIREQYSEILRTEWVGVFNQIFDEDNYTAITVETAEEYQRITDVYPFNDALLEQVSLYIIHFKC